MKLTNENLTVVAEIAIAHPTRYAAIIAPMFGVSKGTARRWVYVLRQRGLIPPVSEQTRTCPTCRGTGKTHYRLEHRA